MSEQLKYSTVHARYNTTAGCVIVQYFIYPINWFVLKLVSQSVEVNYAVVLFGHTQVKILSKYFSVMFSY